MLREMKPPWKASLRLVRDRHRGNWGALAIVYPEARAHRCWNHRFVSMLERVPKSYQAVASRLLKLIPYALTREEAEDQRKASRR